MCLHVFVLFQTVLFSSFSGILSLICFTNCPQALWCFTCVHLFLSPLVHTQKKSSQKNTQRAQGSALCLVKLFFLNPPLWTFVSCAFKLPAFFFFFVGGVTSLLYIWTSWRLYYNRMDSHSIWAVTSERFYSKPSLWSWDILRRTLQLCSLKNCISHAAFVCSTSLQTAGLLSCFGSCVVIDLSAPLVAMAPWTRKTASGPRLCRTSRPVANQRFSGSWR